MRGATIFLRHRWEDCACREDDSWFSSRKGNSNQSISLRLSNPSCLLSIGTCLMILHYIVVLLGAFSISLSLDLILLTSVIRSVSLCIILPWHISFVVRWMLCYLKDTINHGLHLRAASIFSLHDFSNTDWAGDLYDYPSVSGFIIYFGPNPISWSFKKQHNVTASSTKSEYMSLANLISEMIWLQPLQARARYTSPKCSNTLV